MIRSLRLLLVVSLSAMAGCSISDSISSPFESSSASSRSSESRESKFLRDVEDYTASYVSGKGDFDTFLHGVDNLAQQRGITNWEADPATYVAIGKGLRKANADTGTVEAYVVNVAGNDPTKSAAIRRGYQEGD